MHHTMAGRGKRGKGDQKAKPSQCLMLQADAYSYRQSTMQYDDPSMCKGAYRRADLVSLSYRTIRSMRAQAIGAHQRHYNMQMRGSIPER